MMFLSSAFHPGAERLWKHFPQHFYCRCFLF